MIWHLHLAGPAQKEFQKLPLKDQARVKAALVSMQQDPFGGDIKRLKG
jgi:mRNA-degrading endonuclease RelE of RelBE toxin-antitoxin system